jgi:hypothetical protein
MLAGGAHYLQVAQPLLFLLKRTLCSGLLATVWNDPDVVGLEDPVDSSGTSDDPFAGERLSPGGVG